MLIDGDKCVCLSLLFALFVYVCIRKPTSPFTHDTLLPFIHSLPPDLMRWNCNNFSNEAALFLLGVGIPPHILALPEQVFSSPLGALLRPVIEQSQGSMRPAVPGFHFESYEGGGGGGAGGGAGGGHHHINNPPPLVPPHHMPPQAPLPAVPLSNPWANMRPAAAAATTTTTTTTSSSTTVVQPTRSKQQHISASIEPVLARHDKPLLSIDPPAALKQTVGTVITKLKTLSTAAAATAAEEGKEGEPPLLFSEDIALLEATVAVVLQPLTPLPPALSSLLLRTLLPPWPAKAEFFTLSLLRPLFLRPAFPTPALLDHLLAKLSAATATPSSLPSSSSSSFSSPSSVVIALSGLSNVCAHKAGCTLLLYPSRITVATDAAVAALRDDRPAVRQMAAAFLANLALGMQRGKERGEGGREEGLSDVVVQMVCGTLEGLREDKDMTSVFRRLLCAGRVVREGGREAGGLVISLGFDEVLREVGREGGQGGKQVQELAREILGMVEE